MKILAASTTVATTTAVTTAITTAQTQITTDAPLDEAVDKIVNELSGFSLLLSEFWDNFLKLLPTIIVAIIILIVGMILSKLVLKAMKKGMTRRSVDMTVINFAESLGRIILYVLVLCVVLSVLGIPMTSIVAVIGTAGIAIGLALQNSLSNLAGGFIILFSKPFKAGDFIETNGTEGTVEKINILYTVLNTLDNKAVFIPNGLVSGAKLMNYSANDTRRVDNVFSISYGDDYERAKTTIEKVISANPSIFTTPEPFVRMSAHNESSIDITVRVWVKNSDYWDVHFYLIEQVRKAFIEEKIEIPFRQLDVHIIKDE